MRPTLGRGGPHLGSSRRAWLPCRHQIKANVTAEAIAFAFALGHVTGYNLRQALWSGNWLGTVSQRSWGEGETMLDTRISRRAALLGAGTVAAWLTSPARALLQAAGRLEVPSFVDPL